MDRREAVKYTAFLMGAGLSASTVSAILSGCSVNTSEGWEPSFFTRPEADFIAELAATMLPRTHTPGAKEAMVERFLDTVRPLRYTEEENRKFREELAGFMNEAGVKGMAKAEESQRLNSSIPQPKDFFGATPDERLAWLTATDKASYELIKDIPDLSPEDRPFYLRLKEQVLGGFFSSEVVAKEFFAFDPVPGGYTACMPYSEVGKAWALG